MRFVIVLLLSLLFMPRLAFAEQPILQPSQDLTAEDVISIQLRALSEIENDPTTNSGVARVWAFAHPTNKRLTGSLPRFGAMLRSPRYRPLIGHRRHFMKQVSQAADKAQYMVKVTDNNGSVYSYSWHVGRVSNGPLKGMWLTTGVMLMGKLGNAL